MIFLLIAHNSQARRKSAASPALS